MPLLTFQTTAEASLQTIIDAVDIAYKTADSTIEVSITADTSVRVYAVSADESRTLAAEQSNKSPAFCLTLIQR